MNGSCVDENALLMSEENVRLVRDDRKATVTQMTTRYNCHVLTSLGLVRPVTRIKIKLENHDTPPLLSQLKDHNRFIKS